MPQEGENQKQENEMPERTEYYGPILSKLQPQCSPELEFLLTDAFKGNGFQKIAEILEEKDICPLQKYNKQLLNQLDKVLKKELDKNEFANVSLLLKCIQLYCRSDPQEGVDLLLQQGLISKISNSLHVCQAIELVYRLTREFLSLIEPKESKFLISLVEDFFDTTLIIGKSNTEGKKQLLETFIPYLGHLATESNVTCALRQEALRTLNTLLDNVAREERKKFAVSEEMCLLAKELAKAILDVGDYDIQVAIMEALFRLMLKKWRDDLVHNWFEDQHLVKCFREIKDRDFETDCRKFLNELNERLGDKRRVCSIPCKAAHADMNKLKKPADDKLESFWIDFNYGSESVTFYLESPEGALWESVRLLNEDVSNYYVQEEGGEKILKMLMKKPIEINKKEATKIKIHFDSQFDISTPLGKVLGKKKMMKMMNKEDGDHPQQNGTVNGTVEWTKDLAAADSLSDILTSHLSDQSVTTKIAVPTDVTATTESQQTGKERGGLSQASTDAASVSLKYSTNALVISSPLNTSTSKASPLKQKDKTIAHSEPNVEEEPCLQAMETLILEDNSLEKKNRTSSSSEQITEAVKEPYEFGNVSDPVAHEMVTKMKQKVFAQNATLPRSSEKRNAELSKSERRLSASYKNHLFSESNHKTPSNGTSERSWILDSQKKPTTKSADYTRKKTRTRSSLKVLPLSSPSSDSDRHAKKTRIAAVQREKMKGRMNSEMFSAVQQTGITSTPLLNIGQHDLKMADATLPLSGISSPDYSDTGVTKKYETASSILPLANKVSKSKRKLSDLSARLNRKRSKCAERESSNEQSSSVPFKPRKLFNSTEVEEATQIDQNVGGLRNDEFISRTLEEEFGGSGVIAAFENFTNELKKSFWTRYKRMEIYTQNILKVPEHNVSALLNQIHQCRMNELESFHKIVLQELGNLEKRTQFLSSLEKDTVEFWTEQSHKLNSKLNTFCNHQIQRIQSMGLVLGETTGTLKDMVQNFEKADHKEEKNKDFVLLTD